MSTANSLGKAALAARAPRSTMPKNVVGIVSGLHWALMFIAWASALRHPPTPEQISTHFNVSRATAYRYHAAWQIVRQQDIVPSPRSNQTGEHA